MNLRRRTNSLSFPRVAVTRSELRRNQIPCLEVAGFLQEFGLTPRPLNTEDSLLLIGIHCMR